MVLDFLAALSFVTREIESVLNAASSSGRRCRRNLPRLARPGLAVLILMSLLPFCLWAGQLLCNYCAMLNSIYIGRVLCVSAFVVAAAR